MKPQQTLTEEIICLLWMVCFGAGSLFSMTGAMKLKPRNSSWAVALGGAPGESLHATTTTTTDYYADYYDTVVLQHPSETFCYSWSLLKWPITDKSLQTSHLKANSNFRRPLSTGGARTLPIETLRAEKSINRGTNITVTNKFHLSIYIKV